MRIYAVLFLVGAIASLTSVASTAYGRDSDDTEALERWFARAALLCLFVGTVGVLWTQP